MTRTVIISGASRGLGLSLAQKFLSAGDHVIGLSKTKTRWKEALNTLKNFSGFVLKQVDAASENKVKKIFGELSKQKIAIDILINNAGYGGTISRIEETNTSEFKKHFEMNLLSQFLMCKYAIPILRAQKKGLIVNISSMAGKRAVPKLVAYSASKFGVLALSQCVAKENSDLSIKCITVCPGGMNTEMRASIFGKEDASKQQSTDFVADVITQIVNDELKVDSGGDVIIRHGQVTVNPVPAA